MRLEFLGCEYESGVFLVQLLIDVLGHGLYGVTAGHFLYILLGLIAQQSLPEILPQDLAS